MEDNSAYLDLFFEETDENLTILNEEVLRLEKEPQNKHIIDAIFRAAHTLKGMAATMGFKSMTNLTHAVESVFESVKEDKISVETDLVSLIFDSLDTLSDIVEKIRMGDDTPVDISFLVNQLEEVTEESSLDNEKTRVGGYQFPPLEESDHVAIDAARSGGYKLFAIGVKVEEDSMMKAARAFLVINKLEQLGDFVQMKPSAEELEEGKIDESFALYFLSKVDIETLQESLADSSEIEEIKIEEVTADTVVSNEEASTDTDEESTETPEQQKTNNKRPTASRQTIRVDLSRLDQFMNLVSELVIHRTRLEDMSTKENVEGMNEPLTQVGRLTTELQELVLQLRMQPFNVVVQRFPRMMRDLSNELGKDIQFITEGEETELDRTVVSEIGEPLIHLLRNSADHGIEMPGEREKAGKPRQGTVKLAAYAEGNRVNVTLSDDGRGLNPNIIKKSANKKGIDTDGLSDEDIQNLIFHPGFSTAEKVTGVSGRGVGMDAVKEKITSLNGTIETESETGKGTTFKITLPLTLSIIQSLLVKVGGETFAIPQAVIDNISRFSEEEAISVHNNEVYQYEDSSIPLIRLSDVLDLPEKESKQKHIIIVLIGDKKYGLIIDELVHQKEIVIKELGKELNHLSNYLGATILGDGSISLILDITSICTRKKE